MFHLIVYACCSPPGGSFLGLSQRNNIPLTNPEVFWIHRENQLAGQKLILRMRKGNKPMRKLTALILVVSMSSSVHAQWFDWGFPLVPRTDEGKPNLTAPAP